MTYCVGMVVDEGLAMLSDTRTNAGVDDVSVFRKSFHWSTPGERHLTLMTAGNLATTQTVVSRVKEDVAAGAEHSVLVLPSLFQIANRIGALLVETIHQQDQRDPAGGSALYSASLLLGGQIKGDRPRLFLIYPEGNFIETSADTPFLQIGETKYGRPILVRSYDQAMSLGAAAKLLLLSMDSTIKANLSVAAPLDLTQLRTGSFAARTARIGEDDPFYRGLAAHWANALRGALATMPDFPDADAPAPFA
jgi:putative proteasome-type protease